MQGDHRRLAVLGFAILFVLAAAVSSSAQTFTLMHTFSGSGTDGKNPYAGLVQGLNGSLYGTTSAGGTNNSGIAFSISTSGSFKTLYSFCALASCADGTDLRSPVLQGTNGRLYGTTMG